MYAARSQTTTMKQFTKYLDIRLGYYQDILRAFEDIQKLPNSQNKLQQIIDIKDIKNEEIKKILGSLQEEEKDILQKLCGKDGITLAAIRQLESSLEDIKNLKQIFHDGLCLGFAVVHRAMDIAEHLEWWEASLSAIHEWEGDASALHKSCQLTTAKSETLQDIFERVMNDVIFHAVNLQSLLTIKITQYNLLQPGLHFFQMKNKEKLLEIVDRTIQAGYFTEVDLLDERKCPLLSATVLAGNIGILHGDGHAIGIGYKGGEWIIYDSNYQDPDPMYKKISSKLDFVKELIKIQGQSLAIEIASTKGLLAVNVPEPTYEQLNEFGLHIMARYTPDHLLQLLESVKNPQEIEDKLAAALLAIQNDNSWTGLHKIARHAPAALSKVLDLAKKSEKIQTKLVEALTIQTKEGLTKLNITGLDMIAQYAPDALLKLLELAEQSKTLQAKLAEALVIQDKDGWTGLYIIACYAPDALVKLLDFVEKSETIQVKLAEALVIQTKHGWTSLHMIARYTPAALSKLLDLAEKSEKIQAKLTETLAIQTEDGRTGLDMIKHYAPDVLPGFLKLDRKSVGCTLI